jgi:hypothetical protein
VTASCPTNLVHGFGAVLRAPVHAAVSRRLLSRRFRGFHSDLAPRTPHRIIVAVRPIIRYYVLAAVRASTVHQRPRRFHPSRPQVCHWPGLAVVRSAAVQSSVPLPLRGRLQSRSRSCPAFNGSSASVFNGSLEQTMDLVTTSRGTHFSCSLSLREAHSPLFGFLRPSLLA